MHLFYRNINEAFREIVANIDSGDIPTKRTTSRNGDVLQIEEPVIITYERPLERVLFNQVRDCNPFFHVFEALWMLAGRCDVEPLAYYASNIANYSDDGRILNGAYGYRWRRAEGSFNDDRGFEVDQLAVIIQHLKQIPDSRRVILQMWNVPEDLLKIGHYEPCTKCKNGKWENGRGKALLEEGADCPICKGTGRIMTDYSKDVCCNVCAMFSLRKEEYAHDSGGVQPWGAPTPPVVETVTYLDMTVINRSNDTVWGALGANVVHFSFLQEYMANCLGVQVGKYNQISNNLHVYVNNWKPAEWLADETPDWYLGTRIPFITRGEISLVSNPKQFDKEVKRFINKDWEEAPGFDEGFSEPFLAIVAEPMCRAFYMHKSRDYGAALEWVDMVQAKDWQVAARNWITKRQRNYELKQAEGITRG